MMAQQKETYGLIGYPVKHSFSPLMHNAAFRRLGIDAQYELFEVAPQGLEEFLLKQVFSLAIQGFNITIPHKVKAKEILEKKFPLKESLLSPQDAYYVKLSGAINTVKRAGDTLEYFNTDAAGFLRSLEKDLGFDCAGKSALVLGCGGAGRAVVAALSWIDQKVENIYISESSPQAAESAREYFFKLPQPHLKDKLKFIPQSEISRTLKNCALLVNATAVGMQKDDPPVIDEKSLHSGLLVYDLIYNPQETKLLKIAKAKGARVTNGLGMLLYQGVAAFELWTGQKAPIEVMREALKKGVENP